MSARKLLSSLLGALALTVLWLPAGPAEAASGCAAFGPGVDALSAPCSTLVVDTDSCVAVDPIIIGSPPCAIIRLENIAYAMYADAHGLDPGDPRIVEAGQLEIAGILWTLIQTTAINDGQPDQDSRDVAAYEWFQTVVQSYQHQAAQFAIDEYHEWDQHRCDYVPPSPELFTFRAVLDSACTGTFASLLRGPKPPTYAELIDYGLYDEAQSATLTAPGETLWGQTLNRDAITRSQGTWASLFAAPGLNLLKAIPQVRTTLNRLVYPESLGNDKVQYIAQQREIKGQQKLNRGVEETIEENEGVLDEESNLLLEETEGLDLVDAELPLFEEGADEGGVAIGELLGDAGEATFGGVGGAFFIVGIAAAILTEEGTSIARQQDLPKQLQANLDATNTLPVVKNIISKDGGGSFLEGIYLSLLSGSKFRTGVAKIATTDPHGLANPPYSGDQIQISHTDANGIGRYTERNRTIHLRSWPEGLRAQIFKSHPFSEFALNNGILYRTPTPDEEQGGATGWYPDATLAYYDWNGTPHLALVSGDHFLDMPSPGSADKGGRDQGDFCQSVGECDTLTTLFALGPGDEKLRVTLKPNLGTQAIIGIDNALGRTAGPDIIHPQDGGLVAGQTVKLIDPAVNLNGAATTYTWQIEGRCRVDAVTCTASPDAAFHGHPVTTLTGQSVHYTWPSSGTFHVRLTTRDEFGIEHSADRDVTVADPLMKVPFGVTPALQGSAFGPLKNGDSATIAGCIIQGAGAYSAPTVTIDWGDGTVASRTGAGTSSGVTVSLGTPTSSCPSEWSFTATHAYSVTSSHQVPVRVSALDNLGQSRVVDLAANLVFVAPPSFTSADNTTFTAGTPANFHVTTAGAPTPTVSLQSGSLPSGLGFDVNAAGLGTAVLSGSANVNDGGDYPVVLHASSSAGGVDQHFTLTVNSAPRFTSAASATITAGVAASPIAITAKGYPAPAISVTGLPPGMVLSSGIPSGNSTTETLTGTPDASAAGTYHLVATAASATGTAKQQFTLTIGDTAAITSATTAPFVTDAPGSFTIRTTGYPAPALTETGALPAGLQFSDNKNGTATIFGTPSGGATSASVTITATNGIGSPAHQTLDVNASVTGGPTVTVEATPTFSEGSEGTFTVTSSPSSALTQTESLPAGVTFTDNGNGTATIAGTPDTGTGGYYPLVIHAVTGSGPEGLAFPQVRVLGPPTVTSPPAATFAVGSTGSFQVTTSGIPRAALSLSDPAALPDGLVFNDNHDGTATIDGMPSDGSAGSYPVMIEAENLFNLTHPSATLLTITVNQAPVVTSAATAYLANGVAGSFTVTTSGYPAATLTETGPLPAGVTFTASANGTATMSGTPDDTTVETYPLAIEASSSAGTTNQTLTLITGPQPEFVSEAEADFAGGSAGSFTVRTGGAPAGTPAMTLIALDPLPPGLSLTDHGDGTATITGTPTGGSQASAVRIAADDGFGRTIQTLTVGVTAAPSYTGNSDLELRTGDRGGTGVWTLTTTGYPRPALTLGGALPDGVTFVDNGDGTAALGGLAADGSEGDYGLTLHMTNAGGSASAPITLHVTSTARFTSDSVVTFIAGLPNEFQVTTDGFPLAADITATGASLPAWATLTQTPAQHAKGVATLSGTPPLETLGDEDGIALLSQNGVPNGDHQMLDLRVGAVGFASLAPPAATLGAPYSYTLPAVTGGSGPVTFAVAPGDVLPPGMSLSSGGVLHGTPTMVTVTTFTVIASAAGGDVSRTLTIDTGAADHALEITEFRLSGPEGASDWYAKVTNTTSVAVRLIGWKLGVQRRTGTTAAKVSLGAHELSPGGSLLVSGPFFSRSDRGRPDERGAASVGSPGGFYVMAPDTTVTDRAGERGASASFFEGTPLDADPIGSEQGAYQRRVVGGTYRDSGDNASDFDYVKAPVTSAGGSGATPAPSPGGGPTPAPAPKPHPDPNVRHKQVSARPGSLSVGTGSRQATVRWPRGTFGSRSQLVVRQVVPKPAHGIRFARKLAIRITVTRNGHPVTRPRHPLEIVLRAPGAARPATPARGTWRRMAKTHQPRVLPHRWNDGWFRFVPQRFHILTRHTGTFGMVRAGT